MAAVPGGEIMPRIEGSLTYLGYMLDGFTFWFNDKSGTMKLYDCRDYENGGGVLARGLRVGDELQDMVDAYGAPHDSHASGIYGIFHYQYQAEEDEGKFELNVAVDSQTGRIAMVESFWYQSE